MNLIHKVHWNHWSILRSESTNKNPFRNASSSDEFRCSLRILICWRSGGCKYPRVEILLPSNQDRHLSMPISFSSCQYRKNDRPFDGWSQIQWSCRHHSSSDMKSCLFASSIDPSPSRFTKHANKYRRVSIQLLNTLHHFEAFQKCDNFKDSRV